MNDKNEDLNAEHILLKENPMMEDIIKSHIEIIVLEILYNKPMCGLELVKEIFLKYNVLLNQGLVYSCLYTLKEKGILQIESSSSDMRTKKYSPSAKGKQIIEIKMKNFIEAEEYILNSIKKNWIDINMPKEVSSGQIQIS